jgi:hypothetical protein
MHGPPKSEMKMNQLNAKDTDNSKDTTTVIAADAERA